MKCLMESMQETKCPKNYLHLLHCSCLSCRSFFLVICDFFLVGTNLCFNSLFIFVFPLETQLSKEKAMCLSTKSGHRFSWVYMSFFVFIEMCLIDFVDIGGIRLTRRVPLVEQELPTLPEHLSSSPVFSGVRVTQSLVLYVCFVDRCLSFCAFSFGHCVVCSSSIYGL